MLPNLACAAVGPLVVFLSSRRFRFRDLLLCDLVFLSALCAYEAAQLWMLRRTFDWGDVAASFAGAGFAMFPVAAIFAATQRSGNTPLPPPVN